LEKQEYRPVRCRARFILNCLPGMQRVEETARSEVSGHWAVR
jgi:hypothetical protein